MALADPPDHYLALGIAKDATAAQIKTAYRKLVLTCHPDKVQDESKKAEATDNFHRIQTAYETLSDETKKGTYDAQIRLANLRKDHAQQQPPTPHSARPGTYTAAFEVPLTTPRGTAYASYPTRGPERYDSATSEWFDANVKFTEFVPSPYFEEDNYFSRRPQHADSRKPSYTEPKRHAQSPRTEAPRRSSTRDAEKASRHDKKKNTDRDRRQDRESKQTIHVVRDDSLSDTEVEYDLRRTKREGRRTSASYRASRRSSSGSSEEENGTEYVSRIRHASAYIGHKSRSERSARNISPVDYEPVRRSRAPSDARENYHGSRAEERDRKYSDPSHYESRRRDHGFDKPGLGRVSTMPTERSRSMHDDEKRPLKRNPTMPTPTRRETSSRAESKLRHATRADSDDPQRSPKRGDSGTSARPIGVTHYAIGPDGLTRDRTSKIPDARRVSSPERYHSREREREPEKERHTHRDKERHKDHDKDRHKDHDKDRHKDHDRVRDHDKDKSRSKSGSSSKHSSHPKLTRINTTNLGFGDRSSDSPRSSRPSAHRTETAPVFRHDSFTKEHKSAASDKRNDMDSAYSSSRRSAHPTNSNNISPKYPDDLLDEPNERDPNDPYDRHQQQQHPQRPKGLHRYPSMPPLQYTDFVPTKMETGRGSSHHSSRRTREVPLKRGATTLSVGRY